MFIWMFLKVFILHIFCLFRHHYVRQSDFAANELEEEVERILAQQAKETCQLLIEEKHKVQ